MKGTSRKILTVLGAGALAFGVLVSGPSLAVAGAAAPSQTCTGTPSAPGVLAGAYSGTVFVNGMCTVNGGPALVHGSLIVTPGSALQATFALNDQAGTGTSDLTVDGSVVVQRGATAFLGCLPSSSPCNDDPNAQTAPTLSSADHIGGSLVEFSPLGVVVHNTTIGGSVVQSGGGGGVNCTPQGPFAAAQSPVFSDYEDNTIVGSLVVAGVQSCWFGALRDDVHGSVVVVHNTMADPDAMEVVSNPIGGSIVCLGNSPAIQYGDSMGSPNTVHGGAVGECSFTTKVPNPEPDGPLTPISVKTS